MRKPSSTASTSDSPRRLAVGAALFVLGLLLGRALSQHFGDTLTTHLPAVTGPRDLTLVGLALLAVWGVFEPRILSRIFRVDAALLSRAYPWHLWPFAIWIPLALVAANLPAETVTFPVSIFIAHRVALMMRLRRAENAPLFGKGWAAALVATFALGIAIATGAVSPVIRAIVPAERVDVATIALAFTVVLAAFVLIASRRHALPFHAVILWTVTLLSFALMESVVRQTSFEDRLRPREVGTTNVPDDTLFYVPKDFRRGVKESFVSKFNFRSGPATVAKPDGVYRVICVGGSSTYGLGVKAEEAWPALLEQRLYARGLNAEVINAGLPGYTSFQVFILLREYLLEYKPDLVVMVTGFNDMALSIGPYTEREVWQMMQDDQAAAKSITSTQKLLGRSRLYGALRLAIVEAKRERPETAERIVSKREEFLRNIREIHELLAEHRVPFVVLAEATTYDDEIYHTGLSALAEREGLAFFDAYRYFRASPKASEWFSDVVHLTPEGNRVMAGLVMDTVEKSGVLK